MLKKYFLLSIILSTLLIFSACKKPHSLILFNQYPITKENMLQNDNLFTAGKKIYYIVLTERPLKTKMIRVMIIKRDEKANFALTKIVYSNDFRLNKDQVFYYNDYIVLRESGTYCMQVYSKEDLERPLVRADFRVKN